MLIYGTIRIHKIILAQINVMLIQCTILNMHLLFIYIKSRLQKYCKCIGISYIQFSSNIKFNSNTNI